MIRSAATSRSATAATESISALFSPTQTATIHGVQERLISGLIGMAPHQTPLGTNGPLVQMTVLRERLTRKFLEAMGVKMLKIAANRQIS